MAAVGWLGWFGSRKGVDVCMQVRLSVLYLRSATAASKPSADQRWVCETRCPVPAFLCAPWRCRLFTPQDVDLLEADLAQVSAVYP